MLFPRLCSDKALLLGLEKDPAMLMKQILGFSITHRSLKPDT